MDDEFKINKKTQFMRLRRLYLFFFNDLIWDLRLNIRTILSDYRGMNRNNYGYDPTPYFVLQKLVKSGWIRKEDTVVDYGCGKGRVGIFLNNQIGCKIIGIDFNERRIRQSNSNLIRYYKKQYESSQSYEKSQDIRFIHTKAEDYVPDKANCFYFFNPFSSEIFQKVLNQIKESYKRNPRKIHVFFYFLSGEHRKYFSNSTDLVLVGDIDCRKSFLSSKKLYRIQVYTLRQ